MKVRAGPGGLHMFDRNSGINIVLDEVQLDPSQWSRAPEHVSVALTNACDLSCAYCYAPKFRAVLDEDRLLIWLKQFDDEGCLGVGFGGGEPMLYPGFSDLCAEVARKTRLAVSLTTHAHRLTSALAARLEGNIHFMRISVDGVGPTYETLRGRRWSELLGRIEIARELAPFGINFVVNAETVSDLPQALVVAEQVGAVEFLLLPEQPTRDRSGIDRTTQNILSAFVASYDGPVPLVISEAGAGLVPTCSGSTEVGTRSYVHIDAGGVLRRSSYSHDGVPIDADCVVSALATLDELEVSDR